MSSTVTRIKAAESPNYLNSERGILSWLLTTDHKRIALLYVFSVTAFFFIGGFFALLMRLELVTPETDLVSPQTYNELFSMHGIIMVWFFLIPYSIDPEHTRKLSDSDDDWCQGSCLPQAQPGQLVCLHVG